MKQCWWGVVLLLLSTALPAQASTTHACRVYFKEADKFIQYISQREDLKHNMPEIKGNFEQSKKRIMAASLTEQKAICEKEMQELNSLNKMFGPKEETVLNK
ncbi:MULTISPECIES: DUF5339 family protein [Proteus]|jgi:hypothetical protein|uniref:DUF5339 domain-containing protein n=1 Tax=Proteus vulgaris TaxID=585 RepID=A0A379F9C8_PROVU|nr:MULTISPECIES: DUF5339 family protein [Proteus]NBN61891.1 hypothetical protein [Proteus sp. G2639]RNT30292.1 hypothetical protein B9475_003350 [Proteus mirabilis]AYY82268.1 hypothetical protein EGX81_15910 [Proteus vulgaris]KGA58020.1 hypothetical protein DR95_2698 [Proteus vulgaris]MBG5970133.1 DUF5339 domain-containing protein [Proteus vulgaris]